MEKCITEDIVVSVSTFFHPENSNRSRNHYVHAYTIRIENKSDFTVQLLSRRWELTNAYLHKRLVEGSGVVGRQPILEPGQIYEYTSGCDFDTEIGQMKGHYHMERLTDGKMIKVKVPAFCLVAPERLN